MDNNDDKVIIHSTLESGFDFKIKDKWKKEFHFKIAVFPVPSGLEGEAIEVKEDGSEGYIFNVLYDFDTDEEYIIEQLINKIKKSLNIHHLVKEYGRWGISDEGILRGRIEYNDNYSDTDYNKIFVIDGKRITIEEFINMLEPYEGWQIKLKILDPVEDNF
jgi:hypothetical protein